MITVVSLTHSVSAKASAHPGITTKPRFIFLRKISAAAVIINRTTMALSPVLMCPSCSNW